MGGLLGEGACNAMPEAKETSRSDSIRALVGVACESKLIERVCSTLVSTGIVLFYAEV